GDDRGSVDRGNFNRPGTPKRAGTPDLIAMERERLKNDPFKLGPREREIVETAIKEVCLHRGYALQAVHARTEHAHVAVLAAAQPEPIMTSFKAYSTRAL